MAQNLPVIRFGSFEVDLRSRELRKHGLKLKLQDQPFQVLALLLERPGELVTREEIRAKLWLEDTFVDFDHGLNAAVRRLREALNDNAGTPRFVETLPRRGYRFVAPVKTISIEGTVQSEAEAAAETAVPQDAAIQKPSRRAGIRRAAVVWLVACTVALLLIAAGSVIWKRALRPAPTGELVQRQLTANPSEIPLQAAAISPDGKYLAYSDLKGLHLQLIKHGQTQTFSVPEQFGASNVSWLPDGTGILASGEQGGRSSSIWLLSILGGAPRKLREDAAAPVASPDGSLIGFLGDLESGAAHGIWLMDINGGNARRVLSAPPREQFFKIRWSPDGQRLAYTQSVPGLPAVNVPQTALGTEVLESVSLHGGSPTAVLTTQGLQDFYWLPDGRILYSVAQQDLFGSDSNLWAIHTDSETGKPAGHSEQLTSWAGFSFTDFSSTNDGKRLAFLKLTSQSDVYVGALERNGTRLKTPRRLTLNDRNDWPLGWTADSSAVVFWSDRNGSWDVFRQALSQDNAEAIPTGPEDKWHARFSPDGGWFLYMALPQRHVPGGSLPVRIMRVSGSGGPPQEVVRAAGTTDFRCARAPATLCVLDEVNGDQTVFTSFDPVKGRGHEVFREKSRDTFGGGIFDLSPDGSRLAITQSRSQGGSIRLESLSDRTSSDLVVKGWNRLLEIEWAPDGRGLYVASDMPQGSAVLYVDLHGQARLLWQQRGNIGTCGRPSPDGRFLAIASRSTNANAWMIENY
jgi:Tol biopolymer transport system component/DNA-binding winged helix-turn-helix (wHTH) protein